MNTNILPKRFATILIALALLMGGAFSLPVHVHAAIALDNSSTRGSTTNSNSVTFSHTVTSNTNGILLVAIEYNTNQSATTITGVTYNTVAMTRLYFNGGNATTGSANEIWYLLAPATGANNVVVSSSASNMRNVYATSYTGVKQVAPPDASGTGNPEADSGAVSSLTQTIVTNADNAWLVGIGCGSGVQPANAQSNTVIRQQGSNEMFYADSNGAQTPAGSHALNYTNTSQHWTDTFFSLAPVSNAPTFQFWPFSLF